MPKQQTGTIYTLTDPRDGRIRYVGQTKQDPLERLAGHLASASNPAMRVWFNALAMQGLTPQIDIIAEPLLARMDAEEKQQIDRHTREGHRLFNAPHYHRHIADLVQAAAPTPSVLKRDTDAGSKVDEYAHRIYGDIAAASAAGRLTRKQAAVRVVGRAPAVAAVFLWHSLASIPPLRWAVKAALGVWALWMLGFDRLAQDKVFPLLPIGEAAAFWDAYLERPLMNVALIFLAGAAITALASYTSVRESAAAQPQAASKSAISVDIAKAAAAALDAAVPDQPKS